VIVLILKSLNCRLLAGWLAFQNISMQVSEDSYVSTTSSLPARPVLHDFFVRHERAIALHRVHQRPRKIPHAVETGVGY